MGIKRRCIIEGMIANLLYRMEVELVEKVVVLERPIKDFHGRVAFEGYPLQSVRLIYIPALVLSLPIGFMPIFPIFRIFLVPFVFVVPESGKRPMCRWSSPWKKSVCSRCQLGIPTMGHWSYNRFPHRRNRRMQKCTSTKTIRDVSWSFPTCGSQARSLHRCRVRPSRCRASMCHLSKRCLTSPFRLLPSSPTDRGAVVISFS